MKGLLLKIGFRFVSQMQFLSPLGYSTPFLFSTSKSNGDLKKPVGNRRAAARVSAPSRDALDASELPTRRNVAASQPGSRSKRSEQKIDLRQVLSKSYYCTTNDSWRHSSKIQDRSKRNGLSLD